MELQGKQIGILVAEQFRDEEVFEPFDAFEKEGASVVLVGSARGPAQGKLGGKVEIEKAIDEVKPEEFDALVIPGGAAPERLRLDERILDFVRAYDAGPGVLAAICHGPQVLISAGLLRGRRITCFEGIRDDVRLAGALYADEPVIVERGLITSRKPEDVPQFIEAIQQALLAPVQAG